MAAAYSGRMLWRGGVGFKPQLRSLHEAGLPYKHQYAYDVHETREMLEKYQGGSVDLKLNNETGIATLMLNNPKKKNSLTGQMMLDLEKCVQVLENWKSGRGVIFYGADGTFCSGGELNFVKQIMTSPQGYFMSCFMHTTVSQFHKLPLLTIAIIDGNTLGGGAELTTACDFRFMTESAKIGFVQCKMGVTPGWGGGTFLTKCVGRKQALRLLYSGALVNSDNALKMDLVDEVIPNGKDPLSFTQTWLQEFLGTLSPHLSQCIKQVVRSASESGKQLQLLKERLIFREVWGGPDQKLAVERSIKHK